MHAPMDEVDVTSGPGPTSFVVRCDDPGFARTLLAGAVGAWLTEGGEEWGFEINGPLPLIYGSPMTAPSVPEVLGRLDDLRSRLVTGTPGDVVSEPGPATS